MALKAKWTILTYIAAHNNLELFGKRSYEQIIGVGSTPEVTQSILFDWPQGAARYIVGEPGLVRQQEQLGDYDSADPDSLIKTAQWVFGQYPAEDYGLILWSHGSGWRPEEIEQVAREARGDTQVDAMEAKERAGAPGSTALFRSTLKTILSKEKAAERAICFDDGTGHSLDTLELDRVTQEVKTTIGQPLDFLGMDACLMASLEVAYQIRDSVRYFVASEELVPGHSWPYQEIFGALRANPAQGGADFAKLVVNRYVSFYHDNPPSGGDVTLVALDLERIAGVAHGLDVLAAALLSKIDSEANTLWKAQTATRHRETRHGARESEGQQTKFNHHLWDLGSLVRELLAAKDSGVKTAAESLVGILSPGAGAVLAEGHCGTWFDDIAGASVYLVRPPTRISPYYAKLALARDTRWSELLSAYHKVYA